MLIACVVVLSSAGALVLLMKPGTTETPQKSKITYTLVPSFAVHSDSDFATNGFMGSGTAIDPYMLTGYEVVTDGSDVAAIDIEDTTAYFVIQDSYLHGPTIGLYMYNVQNGVIANCSLGDNPNYGIDAEGCTNIAIVNDTFDAAPSNQNTGVYIVNSDLCAVTNSTFLNIFGDGIYADTCTNIAAVNNTFDYSSSWGAAGVEMIYSDSCVIANSTFIDQQQEGIYIDSSSNIEIDNNTIDLFNSGGYEGIYLYYVTDSFVTNNTCTNSSEGIYGEYCSVLVFANNTCRWDTDGIYMYDVEYSTFADDVCSDNGGDGIYIELADLAGYNTLMRENCSNNGYSGMEMYYNYDSTVTNCTFVANVGWGIYSGEASDVNITFNNCTDNTEGGIYVYGDYADNVSRNSCSGGSDGVYLESTQQSTLSWNTMTEYTGSGILLMSSYDNLVANNTMSTSVGNVGIDLEGDSGNNIVENNTCSDILGQGIYISSYSGNTVHYNTIDRTGDAGIFLYGASSNAIAWNTMRNNALSSILVQTSTGNYIQNNTVLNGDDIGIFLTDGSDSNFVTNNSVSDNSLQGIAIATSNYNQVSGNRLSGNAAEGVYAYSGTTGNVIWNNTFAFNNGTTTAYDPASPQAHDEGTNLWNTSGSPHGWGNFWSDWTAPDDDLDGIVDQPYVLNGAVQDYYPQTTPLAPLIKVVMGVVRDVAANPLVGADVTVSMMDGNTVIATKSAQTDSSGSYSVSFEWSEWEPGYTIEATAEYNSLQEVTDSAADASSPQQVDIAYPFEIAQFGSLIGFLAAAALVGIVGAVLVRRGRK